MSSSLIGKFTIKKSNSIWELSFFLEMLHIFFVFCHLETSHFSNQDSVSDKPHLQSNEAQ